MDTLGDMDLFVRVVKNGGLAAAGREVGLSPARVTARINALEKRYELRLLNRSTRSISLTDEGKDFYESCLQLLENHDQFETILRERRNCYCGPLRVTSSCDLGQQHIEPLLSKYVEEHPEVSPHILLSDNIVNLADDGFDIGIRYSSLEDSSLIARKLVSSHRVLCAAPEYITKMGSPASPEELKEHNCITLIRDAYPTTTWYFKQGETLESVQVQSTRSTNDGALMRQWALEGAGIVLKSIWDVRADLDAGRLELILEDYLPDFANKIAIGTADLYAVYPSREYLPLRTRGFVDKLIEYFSSFDDKYSMAQ